MKSTDLMLGDWVIVNDTPYRIYALKGSGAIKLTDAAMEAPLHFASDFLEDSIKPIPLTPEILEKNGFKQAKYDELTEDCVRGKWWHKSLDIWIKQYFLREKGRETFGMGTRNLSRINDIVYVHEFQHALRLCGLTELANNLKIE